MPNRKLSDEEVWVRLLKGVHKYYTNRKEFYDKHGNIMLYYNKKLKGALTVEQMESMVKTYAYLAKELNYKKNYKKIERHWKALTWAILKYSRQYNLPPYHGLHVYNLGLHTSKYPKDEVVEKALRYVLDEFKLNQRYDFAFMIAFGECQKLKSKELYEQFLIAIEDHYNK